jgi:hypothetical protein
LWQRLVWICDIDRIISTRQDAIDWASLATRARKANAERMFLLGPALAERLLGTRLPDSIRELISTDQRIASLAAEITEQLFDGTKQQAASIGSIIRYNLLIRSDWSSRIRYCRFMLAPTDSDLEKLKLSPSFHFVYYLLRPFRLVQSGRSRQV